MVQDGGVLPTSTRVLAQATGVNFNTTNDQPLSIPQRITAFVLTGILVTNASTSLTIATGGFYPQPAKAGVPIVEAAQTYTVLTGASLVLWMTLSSFGQNTRFSASNLGSIAGYLDIWFSLTTPQGGVASADIYLIGLDLS